MKATQQWSKTRKADLAFLPPCVSSLLFRAPSSSSSSQPCGRKSVIQGRRRTHVYQIPCYHGCMQFKVASTQASLLVRFSRRKAWAKSKVHTLTISVVPQPSNVTLHVSPSSAIMSTTALQYLQGGVVHNSTLQVGVKGQLVGNILAVVTPYCSAWVSLFPVIQ